MCLGNKQVALERKASVIPFPSTDIVSDWNVTNQHRQLKSTQKHNTVDGFGYGKGFHDLSDIISHILKHHRTTWVGKKNAFQNLGSASNTSAISVPAHTISPSQISQRNKHRKVQISPHVNQAKLPDFETHETIPISHDQFTKRKTKKEHNFKKLFHWKVSQARHNSSHFKKGIGHVIHLVKPFKLRNRLSNDLLSHSTKSLRDQSRKTLKGRLRTLSALRKESGHRVSKATQEPYLPTARVSLKTHRHNTIGTRISPTTKLRNLRRQLARLKAKLNRYLHPRKEKFPNFIPLIKNTDSENTVQRRKVF